MSTVGIDGCRIGWLCIKFEENGQWRAEVHRHIGLAWDSWTREGGVELALIDIPIGLRDSGPDRRRCESEARHLLGARRSSVFTSPVRPALSAANYADASQCNFELTGRRLTTQSWAIAPKMREVDEFLARTPSAKAVLRETHPELLFTKLNAGHAMLYSKKKREGKEERLKLLTKYFTTARSVFSTVRAQFPKHEVADDDITDAMIAAVAANYGTRMGALMTVPHVPENDARAIPMEMVFATLA